MELCPLPEEEKKTYAFIQSNGPVTKKELEKMTGIKPSTMGRIIAYLVKNGFVHESGTLQEASFGRKPLLYDISDLNKFIVGIDISRTGVAIVLCDMKMNVLDKIEIPGIIDYSGASALLDDTANNVLLLLQRNHIEIENVLGVGIAMVGPVDRHTGITKKIDGFPTDDWSYLPLKEIMESKLGCNVTVDNGAEVAVVYEYIFGLGKNFNRVAFINSGIGIRSGFISSNVIIRAVNNNEAALEHTIVIPLGQQCICGKKGCARCYATTKAVFENVRRRKAMGGATLIDKPVDMIFFPDVVDAAHRGDSLCKKEIQNAGDLFGYALSNYISILNPEVVIINGIASHLSDEYYDSAVNTAKANLPNGGRDVFFHKGGTHKSLTMAVGAAAMTFEKYMGNPMVD